MQPEHHTVFIDVGSLQNLLQNRHTESLRWNIDYSESRPACCFVNGQRWQSRTGELGKQTDRCRFGKHDWVRCVAVLLLYKPGRFGFCTALMPDCLLYHACYCMLQLDRSKACQLATVTNQQGTLIRNDKNEISQ